MNLIPSSWYAAEWALPVTRGKEFQVQACDELAALKQKAGAIKEDAIRNADEDSANAMLSLEYRIDAATNEFKMWIALKDDKPDTAWDYLIEAQKSAHWAMLAHPISNHIRDYIDRLSAFEEFLFPSQIFFSPGMIVGRYECSICGQEYGECGHVLGKAYMGKTCFRISHELKKLDEVSMVDTPANKQCRANIIKAEGVTRNLMTWRPVPDTLGEADLSARIL